MAEKLSSCVVEKIKAICEKFGNKPGELINILHESQHELGYLPIEVQAIIAEKLNIPVNRVYGVVTFYVTSNSISFQPRTLFSTRTSVTGDSSSPRRISGRSSSSVSANPPPVPPNVNAGRRTTG